MPPDNNPAGSPPTEDTSAVAPSIEADIIETLGLSDTSGDADRIAGQNPANDPQGAPPAAPEAGAGDPSAPSAPEPSSAKTEASPQPAAVEPPAGTPPAGSAASAPAGTPPAAQQPQSADEAALREASLRAQVASLQSVIDSMRSQSQPPQSGTPSAPPAGPESGQPAAEQPFRYNLTLPQPIVDALNSGEPEQIVPAIGKIVNDLGFIVHNTVIAQVRQEMQTAFSTLASMAERTNDGSTREAAREAAREQYFAAFKSHKNPLIEPIIQNEANKMAAEFPGLPWDANYINALGARVNAALEAIGAKLPDAAPADPGQANGGNPPAQKPAGFVGGGAPRQPSAAVAGGDLGQEIADTLGVF